MKSNFEFLKKYWPELAEIGAEAEMHLHTDANACIFKAGYLAERMVELIMERENLHYDDDMTHAERIRVLKRHGVIPSNIDNILFALRRARNEAVHNGFDSEKNAKTLLQVAFHLCVWFMKVYGDSTFRQKAYQEPEEVNIADYEKIIAEQEARIRELKEQIQDFETATSQLSQEDRIQNAQNMSEEQEMDLSDAEKTYLKQEEIRFEVDLIPTINYALRQNGIPMIRALTVINNSENTLENVDLRASAGEICPEVSRHIDLIPAHSTLEIKAFDVVLDMEFLISLTEKISGTLTLALFSGENQIYSEKHEIEILAYDEWHGAGHSPELLAAFVTPNHPEVTKIITEATPFLEKWTGDPSWDAYQSRDANRVQMQAAAIYAAIHEKNIVYSVPPASFEKTGQRVRLVDTIMHDKFATCLDFTLLYAACLEAVGLNPIMVLQQGHIFAGFWYEDLSFPESVHDDPSFVTKRLADGVREIEILETTALAAGKDLTYEQACATARKEILEPRFVAVIDVHRARLSGTASLPIRITDENGVKTIARPEKKYVADAPTAIAPKLKTDGIGTQKTTVVEEISKKTLWERRLLDLGLRNSLINMRLKRNVIPILAESLDQLEDALADGSDFAIHCKPAEWPTPSDETNLGTLHDLGSFKELIRTEFQNKRLRTTLTEQELATALKEMYRSAKVALEENGANALYLSLGLLRWYETERSSKERYAPLVMIPVEIIRKSANQGYVIRLREDEPQMNITLLEKLTQDFKITVPGLDPLPRDEHGIATRHIFTTLREAIMGQKRWEVLESAYLGIFSFSQFVMWNDLRNRSEELAQNKIVRSLMDGKLSWDAKEMSLERTGLKNNTLLPLPTDASQQFAVESAANGESFVLHGPPGTGKSQTITTMIANSLAQGKTVLFVAEKMAALQVVEKRLDKLGIGSFCLELHSNKSTKRGVLEQLQKAMEVTKTRSPEEFALKSQEITQLRAELDGYAEALHRTQKCGLTLFQLVNVYEENSNALEHASVTLPLSFRFSSDYVNALTPEMLRVEIQQVTQLISAAKAVGHPANHPLKEVGSTVYSQKFKFDLLPILDEYEVELARFSKIATQFATETGLKIPTTEKDFRNLVAVAQEILVWADLPKVWATRDDLAQYSVLLKSGVVQFIQNRKKAEELRVKLSEFWQDSFFELDGTTLATEYKIASAKWFIFRMMHLRNLTKQLQSHMKTPVNSTLMGTHLIYLRDYQKRMSASADFLKKMENGHGSMNYSTAADVDRLLNQCILASESVARLQRLPNSEYIRKTLCGETKFQASVQKLLEAWEKFVEKEKPITELLKPKMDAEKPWVENCTSFCGSVRENRHMLREWTVWNEVAETVQKTELAQIVSLYESEIEHDQILPAYRKAVSQVLIINLVDSESVLARFSGMQFNDKIAQFKRLDAEFMELTQEEIYYTLAAKIPNFTVEAAKSSELGILQRAIHSGGRGVSIRRLFEQIPNLLPRLCPCMLMSPISAAQYLDPKRAPFDVVIFDEASQLPTSKAVGALARGRDAVIVGDPKQMPPTSFFSASSMDEDNYEIEDLESILDDCLALNLPETHLLWHYRSRHESLIAFSNHKFYENRLLTFPSVNDRESKVTFVPVKGTFDRGKTRQNRAEAEAIVAELKRRCHDPKLAEKSVGVVTFNINQQGLIDDLLLEACKTDSELENWVRNAEEPLFIKNLENVQGDERDVILFSIGYGPDAEGKVFMNFGPLNRDGGWRRLNVAISRSRHEMMVFSTLQPEQINLSRTSSEGVTALKAFLEYASGMPLAMSESDTQLRLKWCNGIITEICERLHAAGYQTAQRVGHSAYRLDIGVVDPADKNRYLLGILLDGPCYGETKNTRDRELAQIQVLEGLGWAIHRVWTLDWLEKSETEIERILAKLEELKNSPRTDVSENSGSGATRKPADIHADVSLDNVKENVVENEISSEKLTNISEVGQSETENKTLENTFPVYKPTNLTVKTLSADELTASQNIREIQSRILQILKAEAPILEGMLTWRVVTSFGITRRGARIQSHLEQIYSAMGLTFTTQDNEKVFWGELNPTQYTGIRVTDADVYRRDVKEIPVKEVANAVCYALAQQIALNDDDLIRESAKIMGYTRVTVNVTQLFQLATQHAEKIGRITRTGNGTWVLTEAGEEHAEKIIPR
ncbi:MAG: DUF3320 domain-containing protein [Planctomycetia bacterium]|nr:DUF3320 domain-containing protein [Planctomycetia bacterium]